MPESVLLYASSDKKNLQLKQIWYYFWFHSNESSMRNAWKNQRKTKVK